MADTTSLQTFRAIVQRTVTGYSDDTITRLRMNAFRGCTLLQTVDLPLVGRAFESAFSGCTSLVDVNLPALANSNGPSSTLFQNCTSLQTIRLPVLRYISDDTFDGCTSLTTIYLGTGLTTKTFLGNVMPNIASVQAIYVPDDLVDSYKAEEVWVNYTARIFGVSSAPDA